MRKFGAALAALGLVLLLVAALQRGRERGATRAAIPAVEGVFAVEGLGESLWVLRDARGVPHVLAESEEDAYLGLGFVHAQDRWTQMQWLARLARGRTAEVVGAPGLPADRLARTLGLGAVADAEAERLEGPARRRLEAYVRGVNAHVARIRAGEQRRSLVAERLALPLEPWSAGDSLAVLKLWAWSLSESMAASLVLEDLASLLGGVASRPFFPDAERGGGAGRAPLTASLWRDPLRAALGLRGSSAGSSAWVLGGAHSASGHALLLADVHLEPTAPALLAVANIEGGDLSVAGATLPGVPIFWTGHNRRVAWAATHARAAVSDLYWELLRGGDEPQYHDGRGWRSLRSRSETIAVHGGEAEELEVRSTHHGPLVDGLLGGDRDPLSVSWPGLRGNGGATLAAWLDAAHAGDAEALLRPLVRHSEPPLHVVYADGTGRAGARVLGWIPRRTLPTDLVPVPGRARWYDQAEPMPRDALPRLELDSGRGWAIAADNRLPPGEEPIEWLWQGGARARRIDAALRAQTARGPLDLRAMVALQRDVMDPRGRELVSEALELAGEERLARQAREVAGALREWAGDTAPDSAGAAAYHVFLVTLTRALLEPRLGPELMERYLAVPQVDPIRLVADSVRAAARGGGGGASIEPERVAAAVRKSLGDSWFQLSYRLGAGRAKWRWGRLHRLRFRSFVDGGAESMPRLGPFETGGSSATVHTSEFAFEDPYTVRMAPLFRFAIDTANLDRSLTELAPGQSEHPGHPHFDDGVARWLEGRPGLLVTERLLIEEAAQSRLRLEPAP